MNPEVRKYADAFATKMKRAGRNTCLNENEMRFLEQVFGPEFSFNFQGLTAQFPFSDYKGGDRYIDFSYESGPVRIIIEVDSLKYHVESITHQQYDDHQERQNDLMLSGGWLLVRFTANMIRKKPMICRRQLVQAVGKCLIATNNQAITNGEQLWARRRLEILRHIRESRSLSVKPSDIATLLGVHRRTAERWLRRLVAAGDILPLRASRLITGYTLPAGSPDNAKAAVSV